MVGILSDNPSKRAGERFMILWSVVWIFFFACIVLSKAYETWGDVGYMITGLSLSVPNFLIPNVFPAKEDERLPFSRRYVTKAYLWIAIFNFIGNYFWTHYFFVCLGARYTFPITITLNGVRK
eukprot:TRINITY_DN7534_c0_g2_i2.p1 TRINITY_DN7534_c0_g2~~TRINITY_DN7534_c0_g2_i2.p1  ORF type:complete len:123 (-),score=7.69 TRINITY_DN7534_c0_g2_i2:132-500(-)